MLIKEASDIVLGFSKLYEKRGDIVATWVMSICGGRKMVRLALCMLFSLVSSKSNKNKSWIDVIFTVIYCLISIVMHPAAKESEIDIVMSLNVHHRREMLHTKGYAYLVRSSYVKIIHWSSFFFFFRNMLIALLITAFCLLRHILSQAPEHCE